VGEKKIVIRNWVRTDSYSSGDYLKIISSSCRNRTKRRMMIEEFEN
jgi:hypothetical protein